MKTIHTRMKRLKDTGAKNEKKLRSGRISIPDKEKIERSLNKLHGRYEVDRVKCLEVNRAKNIILAVSLQYQFDISYLSHLSSECTFDLCSDQASRSLRSYPE
jgi:transposase